VLCRRELLRMRGPSAMDEQRLLIQHFSREWAPALVGQEG
jgi:hypothetical protein